MLDAATGDRRAFAHLYDKYYPAVCDFVASRNGKHTPVSDIGHEVFTRAWAGQPRYEGRSSVKTFLFGVARNVLREEMRRIRKADAIRQLKLQIQESLSTADSQGPAARTEQHEQTQAVKAAMAALPVQQRQALVMVHLEGVPPASAADLAGCSLETFQKRVRRGRRRLAQLLGNV